MQMRKYIDEDISYRDLKAEIEKGLGRALTDKEDKTIKWLAGWGYDTVGTMVSIFKELNK